MGSPPAPATSPRSASKQRTRAQDREIARLAIPAFAALISEPLFLLADAAIVGHLGTAQLAALGIAGTIMQTALGLFIFLAYGTTSTVARNVGAGDRRAALASGVDGLWLALLLGAVVGIGTLAGASWLTDAFGASPDVTAFATTYLRIAACGIPMLLLMYAATGVLRGLQDTRTPLVVAFTVWTFLAFALDAIAIAGQAITGRLLGARDAAGTRAATRRMLQWGRARRGWAGPAAAGDPTARRTPLQP